MARLKEGVKLTFSLSQSIRAWRWAYHGNEHCFEDFEFLTTDELIDDVAPITDCNLSIATGAVCGANIRITARYDEVEIDMRSSEERGWYVSMKWTTPSDLDPAGYDPMDASAMVFFCGSPKSFSEWLIIAKLSGHPWLASFNAGDGRYYPYPV